MITSSTITNTANSIITKTTAKLQLRIEESYTAEDDLLDIYIQAAIEAAENYINGAIQAKSMVLKLDTMPTKLVIPTHPVRSITSITYYDLENNAQTLATAEYYLKNPGTKEATIIFDETYNTYDRNDAVTVTLAIGYANEAAVPTAVKQGLLLMVSDMYERREDRAEVVSTTAHTLLRPYRLYQ